MVRSSFLIAAGVIVLLTPTLEGATAKPRLSLNVPSPLLHNVGAISNCQYRHPDGSLCERKGHYPFTDHIDKDCRCVHIRVIRGGGGTPGTVEVRPPRNTIRGGGGTPGTVEVRAPD